MTTALALVPDFFVLTKYARALVRNNRPCDVTEIGIASTVFQQLNGICNFQSLISPEELDQADDDGLKHTVWNCINISEKEFRF